MELLPNAFINTFLQLCGFLHSDFIVAFVIGVALHPVRLKCSVLPTLAAYPSLSPISTSKILFAGSQQLAVHFLTFHGSI